MTKTYLFRAKCPCCRKIDDYVLAERLEPLPVMHCGDCLMDRTEVVRMVCTLREVRVS